MLVSPDRPVMLRDDDLRVSAEPVERVAEVLRPAFRVAHLRAPQRQQVVQRMRRVLGDVEDVQLREKEVHLGRRLRGRREMEDDVDAVDGAGLYRLARSNRSAR